MSKHITALEQVVLGAIIMHPKGATQDQILEAVPSNVPQSSVTGRFSVLIRKGLVYDTGERRPSKHGRTQRVLKAVGIQQPLGFA